MFVAHTISLKVDNIVQRPKTVNFVLHSKAQVKKSTLCKYFYFTKKHMKMAIIRKPMVVIISLV